MFSKSVMINVGCFVGGVVVGIGGTLAVQALMNKDEEEKETETSK